MKTYVEINLQIVIQQETEEEEIACDLCEPSHTHRCKFAVPGDPSLCVPLCCECECGAVYGTAAWPAA